MVRTGTAHPKAPWSEGGTYASGQHVKRGAQAEDRVLDASKGLGRKEEEAISKNNDIWPEASLKQPYHPGGDLRAGTVHVKALR